MDLSFHPPIITQSTNRFAEGKKLQWCPDVSASTLHKEIICAMLAHGKQTTFMRKITYTTLYLPCLNNFARNIVYSTLSKYAWGNISQENYLSHVDPECTNTFLQEKNLYNVVLICLWQHSTRKLPVHCWPIVHEQLCTGK